MATKPDRGIKKQSSVSLLCCASAEKGQSTILALSIDIAACDVTGGNELLPESGSPGQKGASGETDLKRSVFCLSGKEKSLEGK
jgi:hypothetical protein